MSKPPDDDPDELRPPGRFQFGLGTLILVTTVAAILLGGVAGMLQRAGPGRLPSYVFVLLVTAVPVGLVILFSLIRAAIDFWRR